MSAISQKPVFKNLDIFRSQSEKSDGKLIVAGLILDHGYSIERFATLSHKQKDYIESTLCVIISDLCDHLQKISDLK